MPVTLSRLLRYTGSRLFPVERASSTASRQEACSFTAFTSVRWVITSPALTSERSKMLVIMVFWAVSIRSCSSASSTSSNRSSSVTVSSLPSPAGASRRESHPGSRISFLAAAQPPSRPAARSRSPTTQQTARAARLEKPGKIPGVSIVQNSFFRGGSEGVAARFFRPAQRCADRLITILKQSKPLVNAHRTAPDKAFVKKWAQRPVQGAENARIKTESDRKSCPKTVYFAILIC